MKIGRNYSKKIKNLRSIDFSAPSTYSIISPSDWEKLQKNSPKFDIKKLSKLKFKRN